ncbi:MAG: PAS domain S-box protein [Myxococcales bacterium]|nr:PAS domain S-box protein [Myxococcales bacterium]
MRPRLTALLGAARVPVLDKPTHDLDVAIVDLAAPGAPSSRDALLAAAPRAAIFGVASPNTPMDPVVLEVVAPAELDAELVPRLGHLRARLATLKEAQQRQRDLKVLLELTAAYAEAADVDELFHDVTRRLAQELQIDRVALVVVDAERQEGTIVAASDDAALKDLRIDLARYPEVREVLRTGKPVILEDAPSHPMLEDVKDTVAAQGIRNIAALPLAVRGQVEGVLLLRRSTVGPFNPREVEFLTTAAHATAVAFRNLTRLERVRGQREKEKSARIAAEERAAAFKRYQAYFDHLSDGVAILDSRACVVSLNPAGLKLLDVEAKQAAGRHINALTNPTDDALLIDVLYSVSRGEVRGDVDLHARTLAGRKLTLSVSAAPMAGDTGEGVAVLTLRDVTRQREMAEELKQTTDFLERLIDSSVDAVIAADLKGNLMLFNKAAEVICGYTAAEVVGKLHVTQLYPEGVAKELMAKLRSGDHGGKGRLNTSRVEILSRAGERIPVNMTASIIYEGTRETATVGIFTDLRDRLNLERRLTDAEARLLESEKNAVIVALAGTAAHELNQPLTSVMGYAELLKRKIKDTDPSFRAVDIIHREAERMAEIVKKIGKITRFETKAYVGSAQIVDLDKAAGHED